MMIGCINVWIIELKEECQLEDQEGHGIECRSAYEKKMRSTKKMPMTEINGEGML